MTTHAPAPAKWDTLSHRDRYRRLQKVRRVWCRCHYNKQEARRGRTVYLDGSRITDVPSFYLALGEAVNGPNGYFGGGLDALSDCLCGHFSVLPPLTIRLSHYDDVWKALDGRARCRWRAESFQECVDEESLEQLVDWGYLDECTEEDLARMTIIYEAALAGEPGEGDTFIPYFDGILEVLRDGGAELIPDDHQVGK